MNDLELEICRSDRINLAFFFRAELASGVVRFTAGVNDVPLAADGIETEGGLYLAAGGFGEGLPDIDMAMNGQAHGLTLEMSGVDRETVQAYMLDRDEVVGAPAALGWGILDDGYRPAGPVRWPLRGQLFQPRYRRERVEGVGERRIISVTLIAGSYARRRGLQAYVTGPDQRRRSPTDAACDRTILYSQESTRQWPN